MIFQNAQIFTPAGFVRGGFTVSAVPFPRFAQEPRERHIR